MSTLTGSDHATTHDQTSKVARFGWSLYQQIAGVFAAFGLAALAGHVWAIGWRGFLRTLVGVWGDAVRPAADWITHTVVTVPLAWIGFDVEVPLWTRDYLSVGAILFLAQLRFDRSVTRFTFNDLVENPPFSRKSRATISDFRLASHRFRIARTIWAILFLIGMYPLTVPVLWPLNLLGTIVAVLRMTFSSTPRRLSANIYRTDERAVMRFMIKALVFTLSPLIYLCLLIAVNFWVL